MKELGHLGTDIEGVVPYAPGLKSRSGNLEFFGGLTLGDALGSQLPVLFKEVRAFESIPAWLATRLSDSNGEILTVKEWCCPIAATVVTPFVPAPLRC